MLEKKDSSKLQKEHYVVHFSAAFENKTIGNAFQEFLATELNTEPWSFLQEIKKLQDAANDKDAIEEIQKILKTYVLEDSPEGNSHLVLKHLEINVSGKSKLEVLGMLEKQKSSNKWELEVSFKEIFEPLTKIIKTELYHDSWKRFLRSKFCDKIIEKYHEDSSICSPSITELFSYSDEYFTHPFTFKQDFKFANLLFEDNFHWELVGSKSETNVNTFYSNLNYLPNLKMAKPHGIKYQNILPVSFERALLGFFSDDQFVKIDPNVKRIQTTDCLSHEEMKKQFKQNKYEGDADQLVDFTAISLCDLYFTFPLNARYFTNGNSCKYDEENRTFTWISKPFMDKDWKFLEKKKWKIVSGKDKNVKDMQTYRMFDWMFTKYEKLDDQKTLFTQVHIVDIGGWTKNETVRKAIVKKRGFDFRDLLYQVAMGVPEDSTIQMNKDKFVGKRNEMYDGLGSILVNEYLK